MITVTLHCGQCPKEKSVNIDTEESIKGMSAVELIRSVAVDKENGASLWIVQDNGYIDTYCSKKCAK